MSFEISVHAGVVVNRNQRLQAYVGFLSNLDSVLITKNAYLEYSFDEKRARY